MTHRLKRSVSVLLCTALIAMVSTVAAFGQGAATSSLSGTIVDTSGGVIPGADVSAKNAATGVDYRTVSDDKGVYQLPSLPPGTYTVTVSLMGFKKDVIPNVVLNVASQATLKATLEVGGLEEVVTVTGGADIVQTQATVVSTTINSNQISNLPMVSRDAINAIAMLPGVDTASSNRNSTVSGLPRGTVSITLDGVNTQDNNNKSTEGLFSLISPRLDAIEEVTVSTATAGADSAGQGAVQIKFITRSGTNKFQGSAYFFRRDSAWNSNYWFNNRDKTPDPVTGLAPKDTVKLSEPGFRVGGPIIKDKAFFFFNFEEFRQPGSVTRQRVILTPAAMSGLFTYSGHTVNLLQLGAANGQTSVLDPTLAKVNSQITSAVNGQNLTALTDPNELQYTLTNQTNNNRYYPTFRGDYNLSQNNRVSFSMNYQKYYSTPDSLNSMDPSFPGFPVIGSQNSIRRTWATSLRSTLGPNVVNEVHGGYTNSLVQFFPELTAASYSGATVGATGLYRVSYSGVGSTANGFGTALTNPQPGLNTQGRENPTISIDDTLSWLKGSHSVSMGGSFTHIGLHSYSQNVVPTVTPGIPTGDPALGMFTTANFPGASTSNLLEAQNMYALLTGHIFSLTSAAVLDETSLQYSYLGNAVSRAQQLEFGGFIQDSWRARKNLTLNYGVRYEVQLPFVPRNSVYSTTNNPFGVTGSADNLFKPGVMPGTNTQFVQFPTNTKAYNTDWNNLAPSVGVTWRPSSRGGLLGKLIGNDEATVIRGAYAIAYNRNGIGDFSGQFSLNPGQSITTSRSTSNGNLGPVPLLFSNTAALGAPPFNATPAYPITGAFTDSSNYFDPNIKVPYTHSFTFGVAREISKDLAFEVRYVGNRNRDGWVGASGGSTINYNEANINTNGFLNEFKKAQANLQANIAAGKGNTFAYTGIPGTSPLPVYLAFFSGIPASQASDPTKYTSSNWSSSNFTNPLAIYNPAPLTPAGTTSTTGLGADPTRLANSIAAGLPANYFRANPYLLGGVFEFTNVINGKYDSVQFELRKRLSGGLQISGNYVLANAYQEKVPSLQLPNEMALTTGTTGGIHQALKFNWVYELPFGAGKKWANRSGVLDRIVGGWGFDGSARIQTGEILSFGNVRLVGMTDAQLQDAFSIRKDDANRIVYILPQDIVDNTIKAFSTSATSATGYGSLGAPTGRYFAPANGPDCIQALPGQCAPLEHFVTGPAFVRFDMSASKRVQIAKTVNFEFRAEFLNAFNNINFIPVATASSAASMGQVTTAYTDSSNTQDPGGRLVQLVFRINW
jgi:hypothetical protein